MYIFWFLISRYRLFKENRGGILADGLFRFFPSLILTEMGLGKTVQSVVFISTCKGGKSPMEKGHFFFSTKKKREINHPIQPKLTPFPFLVVCPASVISQWENEFTEVF